MKMTFKILNGAVMGVGIGFLIVWIFSLAYGEFLPATPAFLDLHSDWLTAVGIELAVFAGLGAFQQLVGFLLNENTGLDKIASNSLIHFALILASIGLAGYYLKWFTSPASLLGVLGIGALIYGLIWIIMYFKYKSEAQKMNAALKKRQDEMSVQA